MKEKILIIEDDPLIRNELKTLLQSNGYKTVAPEDFSDVIDQIKAEQPHLIILDIKLPGTSGFSLCTEIRTFSEVPIIFVTSCCLLYTSPSPRDQRGSRMPSSA